MATQETQRVGRLALTPAVALLFVWMIVPLGMTIYFSLLHYSLLNPGTESFVGLENYFYFLTDPSFLYSMRNTLLLVGSVLAITIVLGTLIAHPARPGRGGAQHRAADGHRAVFHHAHGQCAGMEEPLDEPGVPGCLPSWRRRSASPRSTGLPTRRCWRSS